MDHDMAERNEAELEATTGPLFDLLPPELATLTTLNQPHLWPALADRVQWHTVVDLARYHKLEGRLATSLEASNGVGAPMALSSEVSERCQRTERRFRNEALPQLEELCASLLAANLRPTLLKGASLILSGLVHAGERPLSDLDVLVHRSQARAAQRVLDELGYRTDASPEIRRRAWNGHYQDAPLSHPDRWLNVDLHWDIQHPRHRAAFDIDTMDRRPLSLPSGSTVDRFTDRDELTHLCLHFWKDREQGRPGALGQLWDIYSATDRMRAADWVDLAEHAHARGHQRTLGAVRAITHLLLGAPVPPGFPAVSEFARDERATSFAIRRVLAPRPEHIQLFMVTPDVAYRPARITARVLAYLREPLAGSHDELSGLLATRARARQLAFVFRCLARSLSAVADTRAEIMLDHWAHSLDAVGIVQDLPRHRSMARLRRDPGP